MSNSRAFRRRLARGPKVDTRPAFTVAHLGGALNAYFCPRCKGFTVTVDTARGTTPSMLGCRAGDGTCQEVAVSLGYPKVWPAGAPQTPGWEWYRPGEEELAQLADEKPPAYDHVVRGGLLLRPYGAGRGPARPVAVEPPAEPTAAGAAAPATAVKKQDLELPGPDLRTVVNMAVRDAAWAGAQ